MKIKTLIALLAAVAFVGCASFKTSQEDTRNEDGSTKVKTTVKARTFWESKSALANFKASQTEKTQGASVGSLSQESSGTNTAETLRELNKLLGK